MKIIVDGDGCPGKAYIEKAAKEHDIEVVIYCDMHHYITSDYSKVVIVESGFQSVDMYIINNAVKGDIIITQDYGVAAMVLGRGCYALNPKGSVYDDKNIDRLLFERHISQKVRRSGGRTGTHKKRTEEDDLKLYNSLKRLIGKGLERFE
ncbi:YaiI/YqxD family protein [Clostridium sp. C8-1-8]|uniref:YaiI/YqxD family protein n=1 Tax=Clostridium sp. C8-1-8 TaxID=2698831 RepID=UPI00136FA499|nr:YaiI/YqxD family protein [Clostridium sp. C8-1-8]